MIYIAIGLYVLGYRLALYFFERTTGYNEPMDYAAALVWPLLILIWTAMQFGESLERIKYK